MKRATRSTTFMDEVDIDRSSSVPLYRQIEKVLRAYIVESSLGPGDALPTEHEIVQAFGVSRATAREAMQCLKRGGLIERRRAHGSTVARTPFVERFSAIDSYLLFLLAGGHDVRSLDLQCGECRDAPADVLQLLRASRNESLVEIARVISVDDVPQNVVTSYVVASRVPGFRCSDLRPHGPEQSPYFHVRVRHGIEFGAVDIDVEPCRLSVTIARKLRRPRGTPAIRRTRVVRTAADEPIILDRATFINSFRLSLPLARGEIANLRPLRQTDRGE